MFVTKKHLSRRAVLRGIGASLSLPLLDAMLPAQTPLRKTAAAPKTRFCAIEMVHGAAGSTIDGAAKHYWSPAATGSDFEITPTLKSLEPFREYLTIVSDTDLNNAAALSPNEEGADHTRSSAVFLTAAHPKMTEGSDIFLGASIDQIYARKAGQDTPLPSIQLCIEDVGSLSGACGYGYSCVYANTISWSSPTQPLPMEIDPRVAFERLFGDGGTPEERASRRAEDRSILDMITNEVARLRKNLDASDRRRLSDYLDDVREIERRIQKIEKFNASGAGRVLPAAPVGVPDSFEEHVKLMFDLQALAFLTDTTRVSAFKLSRDVSSRVYPESGVKAPFHALSHHGENPETIAQFAKLNQYHVSKAAYFIEKLRNTPDGDGNLLDHSLVLYGSPMGDSHVHNHKRVPIFLAGKASGQLKGNQHYRAAEGTPMANLLLALVHKLGVEDVSSIGDSTGELAL
ncbi:MAG TPA: DUF1552 domain-containing protein [Bryobacteraceae bacterium]|nr:DUF1552 domain-containing protein [Bryobacteraceae bacterium]